MAKIGLMVLVGVVVNNGIVLIDHINNLRKTGMTRSEAVLDGCRERFRPILDDRLHDDPRTGSARSRH